MATRRLAPGSPHACDGARTGDRGERRPDPGRRRFHRHFTFPSAPANAFRLDGSTWDIPGYDNAEAFVARLASRGLVAADRVVTELLQGEPARLSKRAVERRVRRATGLTQGQIRQIERAKHAVTLLEEGSSILDAVARAGYADQPHLNRSLRRFMGRTPGQIVAERAR